MAPPLPLPTHTIAQRPAHWLSAEILSWPWHDLPPLPPLKAADGISRIHYATDVRLCADVQALYVCFDCEDPHIWGTLTRRNDPIYNEEVVEIFIAPGAETPIDYFEFEISPNGVLLDLSVHSPNGTRVGIKLDSAWNCPGIVWQTARHDAQDHWRAVVAIPWRALCTDAEVPTVWRANFYRIERPRLGPPEFSCWSPTETDPPDYHRPHRFGILHFIPDAAGSDEPQTSEGV